MAMIRIVNLLAVVVMLGAITNGVLAKDTKRSVTFSESVAVNGTLVKKGTYDAVFDDQTNELLIVRGRKVVARAPAKLEKRDDKDHADYTIRREGESTDVLLNVVLKNNDQVTIVNSGE